MKSNSSLLKDFESFEAKNENQATDEPKLKNAANENTYSLYFYLADDAKTLAMSINMRERQSI